MTTTLSPRRAWGIALWEIRHITRGSGFWLAVLSAAVMALRVGTRAAGNPALMAGGLAQWSVPILSILFLPSLGSLRRRDRSAGTEELVNSRSVTAAEVTLGKLFAGMVVLGLAWALSLAAGVGGMAAGAAAAGSGGWTALAGLPEAASLSALLVLPALVFMAALCAALDAWTGRAGPVVAGGLALVLVSWLYHPGMRASNYLPLLVPRQMTAVFGLDPYGGAVLLNRGLALSLALALTALGIWLLPRTTAVLRGRLDRPLVAIMLLAAVLGGTVAARGLNGVPSPGGWREAAIGWEVEQVGAAIEGRAARDRWERHRVTDRGLTVEVWLARGHANLALPLARSVAEVLSYLPGLRPAEGVPFLVIEGSFVEPACLVRGALLVSAGAALAAPTPGGRRTLVRTVCEAYWNELAARSAQAMYPSPHRNAEDWTGAASLFGQWVILDQLVGADALSRELAAWRASSSTMEAQTYLRSTRAVGVAWRSCDARRALVLWGLGEEIGRARVLDALREAGSLAVGRAFPADAKGYWSAVSQKLGVDLAGRPGW
jgi:hypothetical protein